MAIDSAKLRSLIENTTDLPTLPTVVGKLIALVSNPAASASDIGHLIEQDQVLTVRVLKLVNSAFYGFPQQIRSIQHAVVILGFAKVKNVVLTSSILDMSGEMKSGTLNMTDLWRHSLGSAIVARRVADRMGKGVSSDDAFIGGLLHDIGKMLLARLLGQHYLPIVEAAQERGALLRDVEMKVLGVSHAQAGNWLAERWRLPLAIQQMIRLHHRPEAATGERDLVNAVHLADILTRALGIGSGGDKGMPGVSQGVDAQYGLDDAFLRDVLDASVDDLNKSAEFFALIKG